MEALPTRHLRVAVLIKQIPATDSLRLGDDGRLVRTGLALDINPFCRRAITFGVSLAREQNGECVVFSLAPLSGDDALREAVAAGAVAGVLISDPAFAGSDTLATARALAAALKSEGPFDVIICGRNSVDADTGQVGPEVAQLLSIPFIPAVREVKLLGGEVFAKSERDDGWAIVQAVLPAVLSVAERSCAPARAEATARASVPPERIRRITAQSLGPGPWGQNGSPTRVGSVRVLETPRRRTRLAGPLAVQAHEATRLLSGYLTSAVHSDRADDSLLRQRDGDRGTREVAVVLEPDRARAARELCAAGARLATLMDTNATGLGPDGVGDWPLGSWGLDHAIVIRGTRIEEDVAKAVSRWVRDHRPAVILTSSSLWGREVAARIAASLGVGLIGDAVEIDIEQGRVAAWKPALGGRLLARITTDSDPQMITLRMGCTPLCIPRSHDPVFTTVDVVPTERIRILKRGYDDNAEILFSARAVVGVGMGVRREDYHLLDPLLAALGAPLACTRKVADRGWLPRTRQVGLTGCHIAPRLYVAIGLQGGANHVVGIRRASVVLAINSDAEAPIFTDSDIGIVGDWRETVALLTPRIASILRETLSTPVSALEDPDYMAEVHPSHDRGKVVSEARRA